MKRKFKILDDGEGGQPLHSSEDVLIIISSLTNKYCIGKENFFIEGGCVHSMIDLRILHSYLHLTYGFLLLSTYSIIQ